jgi:hypothetical protein
MAFEHVDRPLFGVQFHPESVLTEGGFEILANFLKAAGQNVSPSLPTLDDERTPPQAEPPLPSRPVTF